MKTIKLSDKDARNLILTLHHSLIRHSDKLKKARDDWKAGKECPLKSVYWTEYFGMLEFDVNYDKRVMISLQQKTGIEEVPERMINAL